VQVKTWLVSLVCLFDNRRKPSRLFSRIGNIRRIIPASTQTQSARLHWELKEDVQEGGGSKVSTKTLRCRQKKA